MTRTGNTQIQQPALAARAQAILQDTKIWYEFCKTDHPYDFLRF